MLDSPALRLAVSAVLILGVTLFLRLLYILPCTHPTKPRPRAPGTPTHLLVVLGSGGHTTEMLSLIRDVNPQKYTRRTYVVSSGDSISAEKAKEFEEKLARQFPGTHSEDGGRNAKDQTKGYTITTIHRARRIHQPIYTTPFSSLQCLGSALRLLRQDYPDVILTNGPATGVIIVLAALVLKFVAARGAPVKMRTIYIESWARVKSLSLSGKILTYLVDRFFVQWETLRGVSRRAEWRGFLVR